MTRTNLTAGVAGLGVLLLASSTLAGPVGGVVTRGAATIGGSPNGVTVQQSSQRVVIDWTSFNIAAGETVTFAQPNAGAIAFNRTPVGAPMTLSGALNANGGVWLFSPGGMLIGSGARINVGSFVASTAALDADLAMNANRLSLPPGAASGVGGVTVLDGGQISATNGFVLLQGETLAQGGQVSASGAVSYQAAEGALIDFTGSNTGLGLNAAGAAEAISDRGKPSLTHTGVTKAGGHVEIVAPAGRNAPGFAGVINLSGVIEASGVAPGGTKGVIILAGSDTTRTTSGFNGSIMRVDATNAAITATTGDIYVAGDSVALGRSSAGRDLYVYGFGDVALTGQTTASGGLLASSHAGAIAVSGDVSAGANLILQGQSITARQGAVLRGAVSNKDGLIALEAARDIDLSGGKLIGGSGDGTSGDILVSAGATIAGVFQGQGGDLIVGDVSGRSVGLQASRIGGRGGDLTLQGAVRGGGQVDLEAAGLLTVGPNAVVSSAKTASLSTWPVWSRDDAAIVLVGGDLALNGAVSTAGDLLVVAKPSSGQVSIGGTASNAGGFQLTNAELQSLSAHNLIIEAGVADAGGVLRVGDLSLSSDRLSALWLGSGGGGQIQISGQVAPTAKPVDVNLGFVAPPSGGIAAGFAPDRIVVTGALGSASARLGAVRMLAHNDILLGDDQFVTAAQSGQSFDPASQPVAASDAGRLLLVAANWQFTAGGRVLQQNTASNGGFAGIDIGEPSITTPLVIAGAGLAGVRIGGTGGWAIDGLSPSRIDLSGVVRRPEGTAWSVTGSSYAAAIGIQASLSEAYRMNGCALGCRDGAPPLVVTSTVTTTSTSSANTSDDSEPTAKQEAVAEAAAASGKSKLKTIFPLSAKGGERTTRSGPDEITGAGNRDLWMGREGEVRP